MKVYIGKYPSWCGPYQLASKILFWKDSNSDEIDKLGDWLAHGSKGKNHDTLLYKLLSWIDSKKRRKIKIKIHPQDTWGMDTTLSLIILPMLKQLKECKHGSPHVDDEDVPESLKSTSAPAKENDWDTDEFWHDRWNFVLDEMIWAFEQKNSNWEEQFYSGNCDFSFEKIEGSDCSELKEGPNHTFKVDYEQKKKHQDRMSNGFRLFGKYYEGLWN